jgi:hypothetical protein
MNSETAMLTQELEAFSRQRGADLFGVADLGPARFHFLSGIYPGQRISPGGLHGDVAQ